MKDATLFQTLYNTKPGEISEISPSLHFAKAKKIAKVTPTFFKMVQENEKDVSFKMHVWMCQYLIHDFKESDSVVIEHMILKSSNCSWFKMMVGIQTPSM